jgi:hypothetical protein
VHVGKVMAERRASTVLLYLAYAESGDRKTSTDPPPRATAKVLAAPLAIWRSTREGLNC